MKIEWQVLRISLATILFFGVLTHLQFVIPIIKGEVTQIEMINESNGSSAEVIINSSIKSSSTDNCNDCDGDCCKTPTPLPTPTKPASPKPEPSPEISPAPTFVPTPTPTPQFTPSATPVTDDDSDIGGNDVIQGVLGTSAPPSADSSNPLLEGLKTTGEILGASTAWPSTGAEDGQSNKDLPTNLKSTKVRLTLPSLGKSWQIHEGQQVGQNLIVGDQEVASVPGTNDRMFYAHNTDTSFGSLVNLKTNDQLYLGEVGEMQAYRLKTQRLINIDKSPLINQNPTEEEVWLVTCRDADSAWRVVYVFEKV